jgi:hypothetical protein
MLAGATNRTHFPALAGASQNIEAWSVRPDVPDHTDASKPPDLPVRYYEKKELSD